MNICSAQNSNVEIHLTSLSPEDRTLKRAGM